MNSTDDAPDDAPRDGAAAETDEDAFALPRLRRSTYTPPPQYRELLVAPQGEPAPEPTVEGPTPAFFALPLDDDLPELSPEPVVYSLDGEAPRAPSEPPAQPAPPVWGTAAWPPPAAPAPPSDSVFAMPAAATSVPDWETAGQEPHDDPAAEPLTAAPVWSLDSDLPADLPIETHDAYRPWAPASFAAEPPAPSAAPLQDEAPAPLAPEAEPEAATLAMHAPPAGQPWIPQRRSLPDDQLLSVLEAADSQPGGTLGAMDALENEMRLREEEVQEYREWEDSMLAVGTPEALAVVARVRPEFTAIQIPVELTPTSAIPIQQPAAEPDERELPENEPAENEPAVEHDTPQTWFDALVAPSEPADVPVEVEPQPTGAEEPVRDAAADLPAPGFDDLLADQPDAEPPAEEPKRPFGVAVDNDGDPGATARRSPLFSLEQSGAQPTPLELRTGRAARLFWLWFAANSSVVSIGFGAMIFSLGMSLRQSIVAILAGVALSFLPLGLGTLAGKLSGQPTVVVSRAVFGLSGNVLPAVLALVSRVFWGSVLLWLFATSTATVVGGDGPVAGLVIIFIVVGVMVAVVVAFLGFALLARFQLIVSIVSGALIVGFLALTWDRVNIQTALTVDDGPWILVATGAILVFSFVGLVWANSTSDLARYQRPSTRGSSNMLWATFGTTVPAFVLIGYGALLAASDPGLAAGLVSQPIDALTGILPAWYPVPLVVATGLSLLSGVIITLYSGAFALQGVGIRVERQWATLAIGTLLAVVAVVLSVLDTGLTGVFRDLSTTLAVPIAAWLGIFAADAMIRNRRLHSESLLRHGGVYPAVNWVNLCALVAISGIGWGLTTAVLTGLQWQGYGFLLLGVPLDSGLAASDLGVLVALVLGLVVPLVSGVPTIRRQEAAARLI